MPLSYLLIIWTPGRADSPATRCATTRASSLHAFCSFEINSRLHRVNMHFIDGLWMMLNRRYNRYNAKRRIRRCSSKDAAYLEELLSKVSYGGNPQHKKNPGDFGLNPPCEPRAMKSLCDEVSVFSRAEALRLLRKGIEYGLISERINENGFPQNIWSTMEGLNEMTAFSLTLRRFGRI